MLKPMLVIYSHPGETLKTRWIVNIRWKEEIQRAMPGVIIHEFRAPKHSDYLGIYYWGKMLGSFIPYIQGEQYRAVENNAPLDATYPYWLEGAERVNYGIHWHTANDDVPNKAIKEEYKQFLAERGFAS